MPTPTRCARCERRFTPDRPRASPSGRYCESCRLTLGDQREWCRACKQAVDRADYRMKNACCQACRRDRERAAYHADPEPVRAKNRRIRDPEQQRAWRAANPDRVQTYNQYQKQRQKLIIWTGRTPDPEQVPAPPRRRYRRVIPPDESS